MPVIPMRKRVVLGLAVLASFAAVLVLAWPDDRSGEPLPLVAGGQPQASAPPEASASPSDREQPITAISATGSQVSPVFDSRKDLFAVAEHLLAVKGVGSPVYAAALTRIGEACGAAHAVAIAPKDPRGTQAPTHDAAMLLLERCGRWLEESAKLPEFRYEPPALILRKHDAMVAVPGGGMRLPADAPVVRDAIRQIEVGQHAPEFKEALMVWYDAHAAHPQSLASWMARHRLSHEDSVIGITVGASLLECEISASCGARSFATLETCVHTGCSPDLTYREALRASLPPGIMAAALEVRNLLVQLRTEGANRPPGGP